MEKGWAIAYTTNQVYQAKIFQEVLRDHGIEAQIFNKMDSSYHSFGEIEIYVPDSKILKAKKLAEEFEK